MPSEYKPIALSPLICYDFPLRCYCVGVTEWENSPPPLTYWTPEIVCLGLKKSSRETDPSVSRSSIWLLSVLHVPLNVTFSSMQLYYKMADIIGEGYEDIDVAVL
jgi:hypothetical protein